MTLEARALHAGYRAFPVLRGVDLHVDDGARLALLGANGSGKTTLLRCLSGALRPTAGDVLLDGVPLRHTKAGLRTHRSRVQLVLQDPDDQLFSADVYADISFGPLNQGLSDADAAARVEETLKALTITHLAERPTHQLSFGEKKKVAMAGALAMRPNVLLLDEPTAGLDPAGVDELLEILGQLEATIILATHDVDTAFEWASEFAIVEDGGITQGGPELFNDDSLVNRARLRKPWHLRLGGEPIA